MVTAAFNLLADGSILMQGDHAPGVSGPADFSGLGIEARRADRGHYEVRGPSIALPDGWKATIYRDENDEPTIRLQLRAGDGVLAVLVTDPASGAPKDIVHMLTLRVAVSLG